MAENSKKNIKNNWTEKHDEFCLKNNFKPVTKLLWQWLLRQSDQYREIEPDLVEFNEWVKKFRNRGGFCRSWLKQALQQLIESKAIDLVKQYTWRIVKVITKPLSALKPKQKSQQETNKESEILTGTFEEERIKEEQRREFAQRKQRIEFNHSLLSKAGIHFEKNVLEVLNRPKAEVKVSIALFKICNASTKISRPEGWIRTCLRERYWEHPSNQKLLIEKFGNTTIWDELFTNDDGYELLDDW